MRDDSPLPKSMKMITVGHRDAQATSRVQYAPVLMNVTAPTHMKTETACSHDAFC